MLPRDIRQRKYADHPTWWGYSDRDYCIMRGTAEEVEALAMNKAIKGSAYTPTLTPGLQASVGRDLLPAWRKAKDQAYQGGMSHGAKVAEKIVEPGRGLAIDYPDPYLQYLYLLGVGQAIANAGRDIAQIGGKHDLDPQKKGQK